MLRTYDHTFGRDRFLLNPGEFATSADRVILTTILGSCVGVCLRDPIAGLAGMNHFMLPEPLPTSQFFSTDAGRFGIHAMELLINELLARGANRTHLIAKVFGGAHVLNSGGDMDRIPASNIAFALAFLSEEGINVAARDVGGRIGRRIVFFTETGEVRVYKIAKTRDIARDDQAYQTRIARPSTVDSFTLFASEPHKP